MQYIIKTQNCYDGNYQPLEFLIHYLAGYTKNSRYVFEEDDEFIYCLSYSSWIHRKLPNSPFNRSMKLSKLTNQLHAEKAIYESTDGVGRTIEHIYPISSELIEFIKLRIC